MAGRAYLLGSAIVLVTMASLAGWIDWSAIGAYVNIILLGGALAIAFVVLMTLLIGVPSAIVLVILGWLSKLCAEKPIHRPSP